VSNGVRLAALAGAAAVTRGDGHVPPRIRLGDASGFRRRAFFSGELALRLKAAATEHRLATVVTSSNAITWAT